MDYITERATMLRLRMNVEYNIMLEYGCLDILAEDIENSSGNILLKDV